MTTIDRADHVAAAPATRRPAPHVPPRARKAHRIASDAEAIAIARALAPALAAGAAERDRTRTLPLEEIERTSESGLWGILVPRSHGGPGVAAGTLAEVTAILAEADASIGQIPQNHHYMVEAIRLGASEDQRRVLFERVLDGDRLGNCFTEIGTKTPVDFRTTIVPDGDGFVLSGQKFYSTGSLFAHLLVVVANDAERRSHLVFVERSTPGVTLVDDWTGFGQRTTGSGTTLFDGVRVPASAVVPHQTVFDVPTPMGPIAQIIHAAVDLGIARAAFRDTVEFTRKHARPWFETKHAHGSEDPHVIAAVGDLAVRLESAEALVGRAAGFTDVAVTEPTERTVAEASIAVAEAKALVTEVAVHIASKLFELTGARSTLEHYGLDRHWRNARTHTLHDPVRYKYVNVGNYVLNGVLPPRHGAL